MLNMLCHTFSTLKVDQAFSDLITHANQSWAFRIEKDNHRIHYEETLVVLGVLSG